MVKNLSYVYSRGEDTYLRETLKRLKLLDGDTRALREMTWELGCDLTGLLISMSTLMGAEKEVREWLQGLTNSWEYGSTASHLHQMFITGSKNTVAGPSPRRSKDGREKNTKEIVSSDITPFLPNLTKAIKALAMVVCVLGTTGKAAGIVELQFLKLKLKKIVLRLREAKALNPELSKCATSEMKEMYAWDTRALKRNRWGRVLRANDAVKTLRVLTMGASGPYRFTGFHL